MKVTLFLSPGLLGSVVNIARKEGSKEGSNEVMKKLECEYLGLINLKLAS